MLVPRIQNVKINMADIGVLVTMVTKLTVKGVLVRFIGKLCYKLWNFLLRLFQQSTLWSTQQKKLILSLIYSFIFFLYSITEWSTNNFNILCCWWCCSHYVFHNFYILIQKVSKGFFLKLIWEIFYRALLEI